MVEKLKAAKEWIFAVIATVTTALGFYDLVLKPSTPERIFVIFFIAGSIFFPIAGIQTFTRKTIRRANKPKTGPPDIGRFYYAQWLRYAALIIGFLIPLMSISYFGYKAYARRVGDGPPIHAPAVWEKAFVARGQTIAYASPDTTYEVIRERLNDARDSILIEMYDFSATYVKDLLLAALERRVLVSVLVNPGSLESDEEIVIKELRQRGANVVESRGTSSSIPIYHAKVIVIDRLWTLVQSANLTPNSVPLQMAGNRDTGIAVESRELAEYFSGLLEKDIKQAQQQQSVDSHFESGNTELEPTYTPYEPVHRFPSFRSGITSPGTGDSAIQFIPPQTVMALPVISPDNYLAVLPQVLASAQQSIDIYQQLIRPTSPNVQKLLNAIKSAQAKNSHFKVRIILAKPPTGIAKEQEDWRILVKTYGWRLGDNIRFLNPRSGLNCTNKLVIVDKRASLVGSANWSDFGVARNREVCLLVDSRAIADYYSKVFQSDWDVAIASVADAEWDR